jgi:hypothetical protein
MCVWNVLTIGYTQHSSDMPLPHTLVSSLHNNSIYNCFSYSILPRPPTHHMMHYLPKFLAIKKKSMKAKKIQASFYIFLAIYWNLNVESSFFFSN